MTPDPPLHFDAELSDGGVLIVRILSDTLRYPERATEVGEQLVALLAREGPRRYLIDLSRSHYLSSTGFATLVSFARKVDAAGGQLKLSGLNPDELVGARIIGLERMV